MNTPKPQRSPSEDTDRAPADPGSEAVKTLRRHFGNAVFMSPTAAGSLRFTVRDEDFRRAVDDILAPLLAAITAERTRADEAKEEAADAVSQLDVWFNTKARADTDLVPAFKDALGGFLRTSRCGGMPSELSDQIETVLSRFIELQGGLILAPVIEAIVKERITAERTAREEAEARIASLEAVNSTVHEQHQSLGREWVATRDRATAATAERDRLAEENAKLSKFADFALLWCDRGPPHGGPGNEAAALDVIRHHPVLSAKRRALTSTKGADDVA